MTKRKSALKARTQTIKHFTPEELGKLFRYANNNLSVRDCCMLNIGYYCGLRASELGLIRIGDYSRMTRSIYTRRLKGSRNTTILLDTARKKILDRYIKTFTAVWSDRPLFCSSHGTPITRQRIDQIIRKACKACGFPTYKRHWHCLKHSIVVHMLSIPGIDIYTVQQHVGHADIRSTIIYSEFTLERKRDYIMRIEQSGFLPG